MIRVPVLNTLNAPQWAGVIGSRAWAQYAQDEAGQTVVTTLRSPVIMWAKRFVEWKDAPSSSPLDAAAQINTAPHPEAVEAFKWKLGVLVPPLATACPIRRVVYLLRSQGFCCCEHDAVVMAQGLRDARLIGHSYEEEDRPFIVSLLRAFMVLGNTEAACHVMRFMKRPNMAQVALTRLLRAFAHAAYRAHLTRRIRPASRRARVPRPLYARSRPPTCPAAPPVA